MASALIAGPAAAGPLLNPVFQDHAVLQRDRPIAVWGEAPPGVAVTVELDGSRVQATAGAGGRWRVDLPAHKAGGPFRLTARAGGETQTLADVLVGDVWLCSGQSNMEFPLVQATNGPGEVAAAQDPSLRLLKVSRRSDPTPQATLSAADRWQVASPASAAAFSAVCQFMGRDLRKSTGAPIGLIDATWGGSTIQSWISRPKLAALGGYEDGLAALDTYARSPDGGLAQWAAAQERWVARSQPQTKTWSAPAFDDRAWARLTPEGIWEDSGVPEFAGFDGVAWFRVEVMLTPAQARDGAILDLGPIDDTDVTWVNGRFVGGLDGWDTPRSYAIPAGVLKPGRNVVAVRVTDTGGGGGLWGPASARRLRLADGTSVPIGPEWRYRIAAPLAKTGAPPHMPWTPTSGLATLYGGMIAPLAPYGLKGVAWYQGEANVGEPVEYARLFSALIADWRSDFQAPDLTFLAVQLTAFGLPASSPTDSAWAQLREAQRKAVAADPRAGLAVSIDVGDPYDIHPTQKRKVGQRLALLARRIAYGEDAAAEGPRPRSARRRGDEVVVDLGVPLVVLGDARPVGFEVCNAARRCRWTEARVEGASVVLAHAGDAALVRYAWADCPTTNLFDGQGLPAIPFELPVE
ncbi:MAG TPA: sialate O-acetylesterase [Phenylobacterium sp.]|nr:sialate O-acetylesterase [Phenylobacterium sp.]